MSDVIKISMVDLLQPAMEQWLRQRGLTLQHVSDQPEDDECMRTYLVVAPEGSTVEAALGQEPGPSGVPVAFPL